MKDTGQFLLPFGHRAAVGREDFLVTASNAAAVAWIDRWPDWPRHALALAGPAGSGKSHLARVWSGRSGAPTIAGPDLREGDVERLVEAHPAVAVEAADAAPERALLHLFNRAAERGRSLLLIACEPPVRWNSVLADLASRLAALPVARIDPPDDALIGALIGKLCADRQLLLPPDALAYLVTHMERSFAAANRLVAAIDALSLEHQRRVTLPLVRAVLARDAGAVG